MNSPNKRPLSRLATQLAAVVLIGSLTYVLGYLQGSHSNEELPTLSLEPDHKEPDTDEVRPSDLSILVDNHALSSSQQSDANLETPIDWKSRGRDAVSIGVEAALFEAKTLNGRDHALFISGLFSEIAKISSPRDALTIATTQAGPIREIALKALVAEWTSGATDESEIRNHHSRGASGAVFGLEVELAATLARSNPDPAITQAWLDAFANSPGRSEISARLAPSQPDFDLDAPFAMAEKWTDWEKDRFSKTLLSSWAERAPKDLIGILDTIKQPDNRLLTIEAISVSLARQGTASALDWVESLENSDERDAGLQAVYDATLKGIGALLSTENGFPKIGEILPGGALESTDMREGDLIVQSRESDGATNDLYGIPLGESVGFLRGAPGSTVEIRVLRKNETTGELEEHSVTVERDLIILDEQK